MKIHDLSICKQFTRNDIDNITPLGNGLINDTFLVKTNNGCFVFQRINTQVFPKPSQIMENLSLLSKHINKKNYKAVKLIIPRFIKTIDQQPYHIDKNGGYWRALEYIDNTISKELISSQKEAEQIGLALGHFHSLMNDVESNSFNDTLPGFHITSSYFQHYQSVEQSTLGLSSKKIEKCKAFITKFSPKINSLENAKRQGLLQERITHGDPKLNNFLFDQDSNEIVSLIDLDTVKPGLVHYDIADCLRSCCHKLDSNTFDLDLCGIIINNYLKEASAFFTQHDYDFLYPAIELIPFELGLRFFTDYLQGNIYFKVDSKEQNLDRALTQFELCKNIGMLEREIRQLIAATV